MFDLLIFNTDSLTKAFLLTSFCRFAATHSTVSCRKPGVFFFLFDLRIFICVFIHMTSLHQDNVNQHSLKKRRRKTPEHI